MKALILIGGEGTRLRPLTLNTLKCMVPIVNRHFFEYQLALLKKYSIREVVLSICYLPDRIQKEIGSGKKYGMKIRYAKERTPLGTAGAIKNAEKYLDGTTVVLNGDILTDINIGKLAAFHKKKKALATIALHQVEDPSAYGLVLTDKKCGITKFLEKPKTSEITTDWINAGIYVFDKKVLGLIPAGVNVSVERQTFPGIIKNGGALYAFKSKSYWLDIGKIDKYKQANFDVLEGRFNSPFNNTVRDKNVNIGKYTVFEGTSVLDGPVVAGENCRIGGGAHISRSIIWDNVAIGANSSISDSIISSGCVIESDCTISGAVIGDNTKITRHSRLGGDNGRN
jgi:NDP-sugar pyrophosphorylase family protein